MAAARKGEEHESIWSYPASAASAAIKLSGSSTQLSRSSCAQTAAVASKVPNRKMRRDFIVNNNFYAEWTSCARTAVVASKKPSKTLRNDFNVVNNNFYAEWTSIS